MGKPKSRKKKWIKHYKASHKILLVGEGNFSFSACLATAFGSAHNIVATSLDSRKTLLRKYSAEIETRLEELEEAGCIVMHGVNVKTMSQHPDLCNELFDRIVYNFPHAGFQYSREHEPKQIKLHQNLVRGFMRNAVEMLAKNGGIHITHKTSHPFSEWKIVEIAEEEGLFMKEEAQFSIWDYPGYANMRGDGPRSNCSFPVGACSTFKFAKALPKYKHNIFANFLAVEFEKSFAAEFAHLNHKISHPFGEGEIEEIGKENDLFLKEEAELSICDYPGYVNKRGPRGYRPHSNRSFSVGACNTFKFAEALPKNEPEKFANSLAAEFAHLTHKTSHPFSEGEIEEIAEEEGWFLKEEAEFSIWDYPGYANMRGDGPRSNCSFPVGACSTLKFAKALPRNKPNKFANSLAAEFAQLNLSPPLFGGESYHVDYSEWPFTPWG